MPRRIYCYVSFDVAELPTDQQLDQLDRSLETWALTNIKFGQLGDCAIEVHDKPVAVSFVEAGPHSGFRV